MSSRILFFVLFMLFILVMTALDLGVFHKRDHEIKTKEAALWTTIWVVLSLLLALIIRLHAEWIHGITSMEELLAYINGTSIKSLISPDMPYEQALNIYRKEMSTQYLAGYFLEESLSIDNIFVMLMIFTSFNIEKQYYHRVLFWGILGAIVMRFLFIFGLGALVSRFSWVLAIFGVILIYSGVKMFFKKQDEQVDTESHPVVRFASRYLRTLPHLDGHNFFTIINGKRYMTPLFIVLLIIEFSDIIFAVDSIPAVFSVTTDTFIVYFSNIFAIMGLRSLFFLISNMASQFWLLKYGLGVLLCFIGVKMLLEECMGIGVSTVVSLVIIIGILACSILFSLLIPQKRAVES